MRQSTRPARRTYLVECFDPAGDGANLATADQILADQVRATGRSAVCLGVLAIPDDEVAFYIFAADDELAVREATLAARLPLERIVECRLGRASPWRRRRAAGPRR